jgi:multidrug efflux system membrane fusion protein
VFLVKQDQSVGMTPVKVGAVEGENTEVQSGVAPGNLVVVDGADKLRDGSKVELVDPNARSAGQATPPRKGPPGADKAGGQGRRPKSGG